MSKEPDPLAGNARDDWNDWRNDQGVYPTALNPPAQQEPAWWTAVENILNEYGLQAIDFAADFKAAKYYVDGGYVVYPKAQRPWVGLTHEEVEEVWKRVEASDFRDCVHPFAQAIEAKLKEKNT